MGRIAYDLFEVDDAMDNLSVDRLDLAPHEEMVRIGDDRGAYRRKPFFGWAVLSVEQASQRGREVRATPQLDNQYHADIILHLSQSDERRDEARQHALHLASMALYRPRDSDAT